MRRCNGRPRRSPSSGLAFLRYAGPSPCFGLRLQNFWMHSSIIASNPAKTASTQRKRYRSGSCQLMFSFRAVKDRQREPVRGCGARNRVIAPRCRHRLVSIRPRVGLVGLRQKIVRCRSGPASHPGEPSHEPRHLRPLGRFDDARRTAHDHGPEEMAVAFHHPIGWRAPTTIWPAFASGSEQQRVGFA